MLDLSPDPFKGVESTFGTFSISDKCSMISRAAFALSASALLRILRISAANCLKDCTPFMAGAGAESHWEQVLDELYGYGGAGLPGTWGLEVLALYKCSR